MFDCGEYSRVTIVNYSHLLYWNQNHYDLYNIIDTAPAIFDEECGEISLSILARYIFLNYLLFLLFILLIILLWYEIHKLI
jgi:hypothetical protein